MRDRYGIYLTFVLLLTFSHREMRLYYKISNFQTHIKDTYLEHFLRNYLPMNSWRPHRWLVSIGSTCSVHYNDVKMNVMTSQVAGLTIVYSTVYSGADERKHQNSLSLAFVRGIHRSPMNSPHKGPVTRKMFPFDDVIMHWVSMHLVVTVKCMIVRTQTWAHQMLLRSWKPIAAPWREVVHTAGNMIRLSTKPLLRWR